MAQMEQLAQEIARLDVEIQNSHNLTDFANRTYEISQIFAHLQAMNMERTAVENMRPTIFCRTCCSRGACMLFLPCQHVCACKSCAVNLTVCPMCGTAVAEAIEGRFV